MPGLFDKPGHDRHHRSRSQHLERRGAERWRIRQQAPRHQRRQSVAESGGKAEQYADALAALPTAEADILWLYSAENLSFEAIGERVGLSRKSIRGIWARGLKRLKRSLEGPPGGPLRFNDGSAH